MLQTVFRKNMAELHKADQPWKWKKLDSTIRNVDEVQEVREMKYKCISNVNGWGMLFFRIWSNMCDLFWTESLRQTKKNSAANLFYAQNLYIFYILTYWWWVDIIILVLPHVIWKSLQLLSYQNYWLFSKRHKNIFPEFTCCIWFWKILEGPFWIASCKGECKIICIYCIFELNRCRLSLWSLRKLSMSHCIVSFMQDYAEIW